MNHETQACPTISSSTRSRSSSRWRSSSVTTGTALRDCGAGVLTRETERRGARATSCRCAGARPVAAPATLPRRRRPEHRSPRSAGTRSRSRAAHRDARGSQCPGSSRAGGPGGPRRRRRPRDEGPALAGNRLSDSNVDLSRCIVSLARGDRQSIASSTSTVRTRPARAGPGGLAACGRGIVLGGFARAIARAPRGAPRSSASARRRLVTHVASPRHPSARRPARLASVATERGRRPCAESARPSPRARRGAGPRIA